MSGMGRYSGGTGRNWYVSRGGQLLRVAPTYYPVRLVLTTRRQGKRARVHALMHLCGDERLFNETCCIPRHTLLRCAYAATNLE